LAFAKEGRMHWAFWTQKPKTFTHFYRSSCFLNSSKLAKTPRDNQVSPCFTHLTAISHGGLCWSSLNWGVSGHFKPTPVANTDIISICNPKIILSSIRSNFHQHCWLQEFHACGFTSSKWWVVFVCLFVCLLDLEFCFLVLGGLFFVFFALLLQWNFPTLD
jgi:hypothetical protein